MQVFWQNFVLIRQKSTSGGQKVFKLTGGWFIFFITLPDQFYWVSITGGTVCYVLLVQLVFA